MTKRKTLALNITTYLLWTVLSVGSVLVLLLGRAALLASLARYASVGFFQSMRVSLIEKGYFIFGALAALSFIIVVERSLSKTSDWSNLLRKSLFTLSIELFVVVITTFVTQLASGTVFQSGTYVLFLILPLFLSTLAFSISLALKKRHPVS